MKWLLPILAVVATAAPAAASPRPPDDARVVRECEEMLRHGTAEEQLAALDRLKALGPRGTTAIPVLIQYLPGAPPAAQARAAEALAAFGPAARDAVPVLVGLLRQGPRAPLLDACLTTIPALGDPGNRELIRLGLGASAEGRRRSSSVQPLLDRYPDAVAPVLIECLADPMPRVRMRAAQHLTRAAVARNGKAAPFAAASAATRDRVVAALWREVGNPQEVIRECAAAGLIDLDPTAAPRLMPTVITLARDGAGQQAGAALLRRGPTGVRAVLDYLHEPDEAAAQLLIELLAGAGPAARPGLAIGLDDPNSVVRDRVLEALRRSTRTDVPRERVLKCLTDEAPAVRLRAARVLAREPAGAAPAVPVLAEAAFRPDPEARRTALETLENLGKHARPAVPALVRRARVGDLETRFAAAAALSAVAPETWRTFVPVAVEAMGDPLPSFGPVRPVLVLRAAGPNARAALPLVREAMAGDPDTVAVFAAEAVIRIDPADSADAAERLLHFLRWTDEDGARFPYRDPAVDAIRRLGPAARGCLPALLEILPACRRPRDACRVAVAALSVVPTSGPPLDRFRGALRGDMNGRGVYLAALEELDLPAARTLLPELIGALAGGDVQVWGPAVRLMHRLGAAEK
ncbi:MAG TPA: HEAT repeat domain-containing protein [Gemmataceae bacterium]|nr:HEAT repeat domain-containing protein [Gemmataceae bacterium]